MKEKEQKKTPENIDVILPEYQVRVSLPVPESLTATETMLLRQLVQGKKVSDIAEYRHRTVKTVSFQKNRLYKKMGINQDLTFWRDLIFRHKMNLIPLTVRNESVTNRQSLVPGGLVRLALDNDELIPWLQPVVCARTGEITGCEILMRQRINRTEAALSEAFIVQAENSGLIVPITCRLMDKVKNILLPIKESLSSGFHVSVNITVDCLLSPVFKRTCLCFLKAFENKKITLILELTERIPVSVTNDICLILRRLRRAGARIALDDFGTGYCGYRYLQIFPVDFVKLDRSFVQNMNMDLVSAHVIDSILTLSHKCGFKVIAEGVETETQANILKKKGVDYLQGYYYSAPVDPEKFIRTWLPDNYKKYTENMNNAHELMPAADC